MKRWVLAGLTAFGLMGCADDPKKGDVGSLIATVGASDGRQTGGPGKHATY